MMPFRVAANIFGPYVRQGLESQNFNRMNKDDLNTNADAGQAAPPDAKHLKDLIPRDISRCSDDRCASAVFCKRYLQMGIDHKKGEKLVSVTDFKGSEKFGSCGQFLDVDVV
jgi:hypothetical protein